MSVHFTCPSLRHLDPDIDLPSIPCPGHRGPCQVLGTISNLPPKEEPQHTLTSTRILVDQALKLLGLVGTD